MKRLAWLVLLAAAPVLAAQTPADSGHAGRRAHMRAEFEQRREARVRQVLGLTDEQAAKLRATEQHLRAEREAIMKRQHEIMGALRTELRPGVAANVDSVRKLLDAREQNEIAFGQLRRDANREMAAYLSPVQRGQLQLLRQQWRARMAHRNHWRGGRHHGRDREQGSRDDNG